MWNLAVPSTNGFGPFLPGVFNMQHLEHNRTEQSEQPGQVSPSDECGHTNASIAAIVTCSSTWQHARSINEGRIVRHFDCTRRRPSFCFLAGGAATSLAAGLVDGQKAAILAALSIADEYFQAHEELERAQVELAARVEALAAHVEGALPLP